MPHSTAITSFPEVRQLSLSQMSMSSYSHGEEQQDYIIIECHRCLHGHFADFRRSLWHLE